MMSELRGEGGGSTNSDISKKGQYTKFGHREGMGSKNRQKVRTSYMEGPQEFLLNRNFRYQGAVNFG